MRLFSIFIHAMILWIMICCVTTLKQRHDFAKSIIGDLDDVVVEMGLISDKRLHIIGRKFGLCDDKRWRK